MNKREVLARAKNDLGDCKALAEQLNRALDYAQDHIAELQEEYYLDTPQGIVVSIDLGDNMMASEFLGTVFALCPSGKYYTPWANSNVESCNRCKGKGCDFCGHLGSREAFEDQLYYETLDDLAEKHGMYIMSGEGDPCDVFVCVSREIVA